MEITDSLTNAQQVFITTPEEQKAQTRFADNFSTFLTLLTTQLTNQDPLSPLDTHEFTNQLVQFASIEQQIEQSSNLRKLYDVIDNSQLTNSLSYIGKQIEYKGSHFELGEEGGVELKYELPPNIKAAKIRIINSDGRTINEKSLQVESGLQSTDWDGKEVTYTTTAPLRQAKGTYQFIIDVEHTENADQNTDRPVYYSPATVTGILNTENGLQLKLSVDQEVDLADVTYVQAGS